MSGKAARIVLTEKQQDILFRMTLSTTVSQRLLQRARIVMLAFERRQNEDIADIVQLNRKQVGLWRRRWKESFDALVSIECRETPNRYTNCCSWGRATHRGNSLLRPRDCRASHSE